jgi:hypothetical protein
LWFAEKACNSACLKMGASAHYRLCTIFEAVRCG